MKKPYLRIPYALAVHGKEEKKAVNKVLDEHRTNLGQEVIEFEESVAKHFGKKFGLMVNSGSSANLLALSLLDLPKESEIITPLLTFSTTVSPMIQLGLTPVFVDVEEGKFTINIDSVEKAITPKTKAIMVPLLMGNIPDLARLQKIAKKNNLLFIEDSCDTFGGSFNKKPSGMYSDITTTSFFGSHIITAGGNGGMVLFNNKDWLPKARMLRGWGRSSSAFSESESIDKRFAYKIDGIAYDAKFIFEEIGYNLLPNEMGAAFGNAQLKKLPKFRKTRERNFSHLSKFFKKYENYFILPIQNERVSTQWLAFPLTIRDNAPFTRLELVKYLEEQNIQTRPIFTGNILRQPGFKTIKHRVVGSTEKTNTIMERGFVIGCHHGLEKEHLDRIEAVVNTFMKRYQK